MHREFKGAESYMVALLSITSYFQEFNQGKITFTPRQKIFVPKTPSVLKGARKALHISFCPTTSLTLYFVVAWDLNVQNALTTTMMSWKHEVTKLIVRAGSDAVHPVLLHMAPKFRGPLESTTRPNSKTKKNFRTNYRVLKKN